MYDPIAGQQKLWEWNAASRTWGAFAQDTWKARRNLTVTLGFRYDDQGNPVFADRHDGVRQLLSGERRDASRSRSRTASRGPATERAQAFTEGLQPARRRRLGRHAATGDWVVRGGFGVYANWLTSANVQEEFRGNPPGLILPTFFAGTSTPPVFAQGTRRARRRSDSRSRSLAGSALCPDGAVSRRERRHRGRRRADRRHQSGPEVARPRTSTPPRSSSKLGTTCRRSVLYSGSHSTNLRRQRQPGGPRQLRRRHQRAARRSARPSRRARRRRGSIPASGRSPMRTTIASATTTGSRSTSGDAARGTFFDVSYTRSSSKDDAGNYPTAINPHQFYGPSPWDVPNRFSATVTYLLPGMGDGHGVMGVLTEGWGVSVDRRPAVGLSDDGPHRRAVHGRRRLQRRRRQPGLPERHQLRHEPIARRVSERRVLARTVHRAHARHQRQREDAAVPSAGFLRGGSRGLQEHAPGRPGSTSRSASSSTTCSTTTICISATICRTGGFGKAISQQLPRWWQFGAKLTF